VSEPQREMINRVSYFSIHIEMHKGVRKVFQPLLILIEREMCDRGKRR
jgi:hypothetical protein